MQKRTLPNNSTECILLEQTMSERAKEYYTTTAQTYNARLPILLAEGRSVVLFEEAIPIHMRNREIGASILTLGSEYESRMNSMRPFAFNVAKAQYPDVPEINVPYNPVGAELWDRLKPTHTKAGRLYDFRLEPIAPDEVPQSIRPGLKRARRQARFTALEASEEVYGLVSAALHAGRSRGRVACIAQLYMPCQTEEGVVTGLAGIPRLTTTALNTNRLLEKSILKEARAIATIVEEHAAAQPPISNKFEGNR